MTPIKDLMSTFRSSCSQDDDVTLTAQRMSSCSILFLPVVDDNEKVIGFIKYDDVRYQMAQPDPAKHNICIKDVMHEPVLINCNDDEASALLLMRHHHSSYLPVVDEENHLQGVISFMTVARRVIKLKQEIGSALFN